MTSAAQARGAIYAALGGLCCAGLLALWLAQDRAVSRAVQSDGRANTVREFAASAPSVARLPSAASRVDSGPSVDESGIGNPQALAGLILAVSDADTNVRVDAVSDLGLLGDAQAQSLLAITAMQDPAPSVRVEALYALGSLHAESQLEAFRQALTDPDQDVRKAAISALEELGGVASIELLSIAMSSHDAAVSAAAAEALADVRSAK